MHDIEEKPFAISEGTGITNYDPQYERIERKDIPEVPSQEDAQGWGNGSIPFPD